MKTEDKKLLTSKKESDGRKLIIEPVIRKPKQGEQQLND